MPLNTLSAANCIDMQLYHFTAKTAELAICQSQRRRLVAARCVLDTQRYLRALFIGQLTSLLHRALTAVGLPGAWFVTWKSVRSLGTCRISLGDGCPAVRTKG